HTRFSRDWSSDVCSSDLLACETPASRAMSIILTVMMCPLGTLDRPLVGGGRLAFRRAGKLLGSEESSLNIQNEVRKDFSVSERRSEERGVGKERRSMGSG